MLEKQFVERYMIRKFNKSTQYLCRHVKTDVDVTIEKFEHPKGLTEELAREISTESGDRKVLSNLSTLQRTLHIIRTDTHTWFICENVEGQHLSELIKNGPLEIPQARYLFFLMTYTCLDLHGRGYAIRDFNPNNINFFSTMVKYTCYRELIHIGMINNKDTLSWIGDPRFMAPEMLSPGEYDIMLANIYCLGLYLYSFLTGKLFGPHHNQGNFYRNYRFPNLNSLEGKIDCKGLDLLKQILVFEPSKRITLRQILNHDFMKPHVPFPHFHPPIQIEPEIRKWLIRLNCDPEECLADMKELTVSRKTLMFNLSLTAVARGNLTPDNYEEPDVVHEIPLELIMLPDHLELLHPLPDKINPDLIRDEIETKSIIATSRAEELFRRAPVPRRISYKPRSQSAQCHKLLDFCRSRLEERGINVSKIDPSTSIL